METIAFLILRITLAWMFLYPLKSLLSDWQATVNLVRLLTPWQPQLLATLMVIVMMAGAISILFGIYAQVGAAMLFVYCLLGAHVHYKLAASCKALELSKNAASADIEIMKSVQTLGIVGNITSAQKNLVLAASLLVIVLIGSGAYSFTANLI